ncbi:DUF169 domain-containing protein [Methanobrevibacter filiformis]|uniref:ArCR n=1 Tax=Methanobrevibacter filiformis TaxID=55758 RepID=A0A162FLU0_9EURY|nr:DUF169 domain-containing protein [Methanobrevibacter filiformis]KZX11910.1 hypothetical protein MBFIL_13010 [Methanobrevibacter filiformis]
MSEICETIIENNEYFAKELKDLLDLKYFPVAIKFIINEEDVPEDLENFDGKIRHCEMVKKAAEGSSFYATSKNQACKGGSAAIGLEKIPKKIVTGEFYFNLKRFKSIGSAKRTLNEIPKIDIINYGIAYAPLNEARFQADIIVLFATPKQAMKLSQAIVYTLGGRINANYAGIQSVCADVVAGPYITKTPNMSLACSGARKFAKIKDDEMVIGLNGENIGCVVTALQAISS